MRLGTTSQKTVATISLLWGGRGGTVFFTSKFPNLKISFPDQVTTAQLKTNILFASGFKLKGTAVFLKIKFPLFLKDCTNTGEDRDCPLHLN